MKDPRFHDVVFLNVFEQAFFTETPTHLSIQNKSQKHFKQLFVEAVKIMTVFDPPISVYFGIDETTRVRLDRNEPRSIIQLMNEHYTPHENTTAALRTALSIEAAPTDSTDTDDKEFKIDPVDLLIKEEPLVQKHNTDLCCTAKLNESHRFHQCKWIDTHACRHKTVCVSLNDGMKRGIYFNI